MITKLARLEFERFTKPSNFDFLRVHQICKTNLFFEAGMLRVCEAEIYHNK